MGSKMVPVPHSLGAPDGYLAKTEKSKLLHYLVDKVSDANIPAIQYYKNLKCASKVYIALLLHGQD